ncbi:MAG: lamin tail domain-containing protein [Planctomycetes bacterium]|nr:lamin tail domain-containing protein [Planctomycetota bacterium]
MKFQLKQPNILFLIPVLVVLWYAPLSQALVVSELMYHPVEEGGVSTGDQRLEFIELYNDRAVFEDISGYTFSNDIDYTFPAGTVIGGKEYLVIAKEPALVEATYGITGVLGPYDKRFKDSGDRVDLATAVGEITMTFAV